MLDVKLAKTEDFNHKIVGIKTNSFNALGYLLSIVEIVLHSSLFFLLSFKYGSWDLSIILLPYSAFIGFHHRAKGFIISSVFSIPLFLNIEGSFFELPYIINSPTNWHLYFGVLLFSVIGNYIGSSFKEGFFVNSITKEYNHSFLTLLIIPISFIIHIGDYPIIPTYFSIGSAYFILAYMVYIGFSYVYNFWLILTILLTTHILVYFFLNTGLVADDEYLANILYSVDSLNVVFASILCLFIGSNLKHIYNGRDIKLPIIKFVFIFIAFIILYRYQIRIRIYFDIPYLYENVIFDKSQLIISSITIYLFSYYLGIKSRWQYILLLISLFFISSCASTSISNSVTHEESVFEEIVKWMSSFPENKGYVGYIEPIKLGSFLEIVINKIYDTQFTIKIVSIYLFGYLSGSIKKIPSYYEVIARNNVSIIYNIIAFASLVFLIYLLTNLFSWYRTFEYFFENKFIIFCIFVLVYTASHQIPIYLVSSVVRRGGILFCRKNYPEYEHIHEYIEYMYGSEQEIYVIPEKHISRWNFSRQVYGIYGICNPIIDSSTLGTPWNDEDDSRLIFVINRELGKIKLSHTSLWRYTYLLILIPYLQLIFLYLRRVSYYQELTFAYLKTQNYNSIMRAIFSEEKSSQPRNSHDLSFSERQTTLMQTILELISSKPSIYNQAKHIKSLQYLKERNHLSFYEWKFGYLFRRSPDNI